METVAEKEARDQNLDVSKLPLAQIKYRKALSISQIAFSYSEFCTLQM